MFLIEARNAHCMLPLLLTSITEYGVDQETRNGPAVKLPMPVSLLYQKPRERVLFWDQRDANPFFHCLEGLWMLAGRNDLNFVGTLVSNMANFSDDGKTLHGAYGYRWRKHFGDDQLTLIIEKLRADRNDRRIVLDMWDPTTDLARNGRDVPCNTQILFTVNFDALDMMVTNRSNDAAWGALGANVVHFSMLQEFVASAVGLPVGRYWQVSSNMHLYTGEKFYGRPLESIMDIMYAPLEDPYEALEGGPVEPYPLISIPYLDWLQELELFLGGQVMGLREPFFRQVASPIWRAYLAYKDLDGAARYEEPLRILEKCAASDWRLASMQWINRRWKNWRERENK